jgi:hypothetical protein
VGYVAVGCGSLLAVVFAVAAAGKVRPAAFRAFAESLADLRLVPRRWRVPSAAAVVVAEAGVAMLIAVPVTARFGLTAAMALAAVFTIGISIALLRDDVAPCLCFGARSRRPIGRAQQARCAVLTGTGAVGFAAVGPGAVHPAGVAVAVAVGAVAAVLLIRLDDLVELFHAQPLRQESVR